MKKIPFTVIRGNISEIKTLALGSGTTKGVDADVADKVTDENLDSAVAFAKNFAKDHNCVVAITGAIDLVADADTCYVIRNGRAEMGSITGTGCQLSGMMTAYRCCRCLRDGTCRRDRLEPYETGRRQLHLPEPHHRRHLPHGRRDAGERCKV